MAEHTPAPIPTRGVYGFAIFLLFKTLFIIYVIWAYLPLSFLEDVLGLTYLPNKYFAVFLPILVLVAMTLFAFLIYPSLGISMTLNIDDTRTIKDKYSIKRCEFHDCDNEVKLIKNWSYAKFCPVHLQDDSLKSQLSVDSKITNYCDCADEGNCFLNKTNYLEVLDKRKPVPKISDMNISDVNRQLYMNRNKN